MSRDQWAAIQRGDESYAGSPSWYAFLDGGEGAVPVRARDPDPPGPRGREDPVQRARRAGQDVPNNTHFDTTRANVEFTGAEAVDLPDPRGARARAREHPFKGNMDVDALERRARRARRDVPVVFVTVTNNSGGGQPVSLENLRARARGLRPLRRPALPRRLPVRRERVVHPAARGRLRRRAGARHRARDGLARRRHDDVRQEGPARATSAAGWR